MSKLSFDPTEQSFELTDVELDTVAGGKPSLTDFRFVKIADAVTPATPTAADTFCGFLAALLS